MCAALRTYVTWVKRSYPFLPPSLPRRAGDVRGADCGPAGGGGVRPVVVHAAQRRLAGGGGRVGEAAEDGRGEVSEGNRVNPSYTG